MSSVDSLNKKLLQDEEWLRNFQSSITRGAQLRTSIEKILNDFEQHIDQLECNVLPMHETNGKLQIKQQNIQRLLKNIDATVRFYGKTGELESAIRDGSPSLDLGAYVEQMEHLQQAVAFFHEHPNYGTQLENMKLTLESGYVLLEKEYRNVVNSNSFPAEPSQLVDCLDEQYELITSRVRDVRNVKSPVAIAKLGDWLLKRGRPKRFLSAYWIIRGDQMQRTLMNVAQQHSNGTLMLSQVSSSAAMLQKLGTPKGPQKKARFAVDRGPGIREAEGAETECALLVLGSFVALIAVEESVLEKAITDVSVRALVHRELFAKPLAYAVKVATKAVLEGEGSLPSLLPLLRFMAAHNNQLTTIAANCSLEAPYSSCYRSLTIKCSSLLNDYFEKANADSKFVPADGNVHPITASVVTNQVLTLSAAPNEPPALLMPKLFARMLSALGQMLRSKAEAYDDVTLGAVFSLNNSNYIAKALDDEESGLLPVLREQNANILQYYVAAIQKYISEYMASWYSVLQSISAVDQLHPDDRTAMRNMILTFNREFEQAVAEQRDYCVADAALAEEVRAKVKAAVVPMYARLYAKANRLTGEHSLSKYLKYTEESLDVNIDRLFDVSA